MIKQLYATRISIEIKVIMSSQGFGPRMTLARVSSRVQDFFLALSRHHAWLSGNPGYLRELPKITGRGSVVMEIYVFSILINPSA